MISVSIPMAQLQMFFLIFLRVGAILTTMPIFKSKSIPVLFKAGLALATSLALYPILNIEVFPVLTNVISFALGAVSEILLGITIGLTVNLIFAGIQMAGQIAGYQMGLALANVMDPNGSQQIPLLAQFNQMFAILIFLTANVHHWFFRAFVDSYQLVPPFGFQFSSSLAQLVMHIAQSMFVIAIKISAPVIAALLLTSLVFGLVARTVPQMNVFLVAMPLKIVIGLVFIGFSLPYLSSFFNGLFHRLRETIILILKASS